MKLFEGEDILYRIQHKGFAVEDVNNKSVIAHGAIVNKLGDDIFADAYFELSERVIFNLDEEKDRVKAYKFIDEMITQLTALRSNISGAVVSLKTKREKSLDRLSEKVEVILTDRQKKMLQEEVNKLHMKDWKPSNACVMMKDLPDSDREVRIDPIEEIVEHKDHYPLTLSNPVVGPRSFEEDNGTDHSGLH